MYMYIRRFVGCVQINIACEDKQVDGVGSRHLLHDEILQERYLWGCWWCCRLSDSPCPLFSVPLVSHLHKRAAAACFLPTTSTTTYITLHASYTFTLFNSFFFYNGHITASLGVPILGGDQKCLQVGLAFC